jgi:hypothetical protein
MDWSRGGMWSLPIDDNGNLNTAVDQLWVVGSGRASPIDAVVGPDGAVYLAEYGGSLYNGSAGKITRLKCAGCQAAPADYVGSPEVLDPEAPVVASSIAPVATLGRSALVGLAALSLIAVGLRRRRRVVG